MGLVLSICFVIAVVLNSENNFIANCEANSLGVAWCSYNERTNRLHVYRRLLTNRHYQKWVNVLLEGFNIFKLVI